MKREDKTSKRRRLAGNAQETHHHGLLGAAQDTAEMGLEPWNIIRPRRRHPHPNAGAPHLTSTRIYTPEQRIEVPPTSRRRSGRRRGGEPATSSAEEGRRSEKLPFASQGNCRETGKGNCRVVMQVMEGGGELTTTNNRRQ